MNIFINIRVFIFIEKFDQYYYTKTETYLFTVIKIWDKNIFFLNSVLVGLSDLNIIIVLLCLARPLLMDLSGVLVQADIVLEPLETQVALLFLIFTVDCPKSELIFKYGLETD